MKVHIINHRCGDDEIEVKNGIRVFDWDGNEFIQIVQKSQCRWGGVN